MSLIKKLFLLVFAMGGHHLMLIAQFHQTEIFTINDGMALTECGLIFCDRSGKIWINHSTGWISVYDGYSFTRYDPKETGAYLDGAQFVEDRSGIWIRKEKTVSLFSNGAWKYFDTPLIWQMIVDKESDTMVLLDKSGVLWKLNGDGSAFVSFGRLPLKNKGEEYNLMPSRYDQSYLLLITKTGTPYNHKNAYISHSMVRPEWLETPSLVNPGLDWTYNYSSSEQLTHIRAHFPGTHHPEANTQLFSSGKDLIYAQIYPKIGSNNYIIETFRVDSANSFQFLARFTCGHGSVSITIDQVGNIWAGSHSGLFKVSPSIIQCLDDMTYMVSSLHAINEDEHGQIWFGGYTTGLSYFKDEMLFPCPAEAIGFKRFLPGSYRDHKGTMAFWSEDHDMIIYKQGKWQKSILAAKEEERIRGYYFLQIDGHRVAAGLQRYGLGITTTPLTIHSSWKIISKEKGMLLDNVLTIAEDANHKLWLGRSSQGIAVYDPITDTAQTWLLAPDTELNYGMASSVIDPAGRLWMGCSDGLRVINHPEAFTMFNDDLLSKVQKVNLGEAGNSQINILTTYGQFLIFGNSAGYAFLDLNSFAAHPESPHIRFFPMEKFGLSCEQNAVLIDRKEHLWIGHERGAMRIDLKGNIFETGEVRLVAKNIISHGKNGDSTSVYFDSLNTVKLPFGKRNIIVRIRPAINTSLNDNIYLQYSLLSGNFKDTVWSSLSKNFDISLEILPPGKNLLLIKGVRNNQIVTQQSYFIAVPPGLTEIFWFWFIIFCLTSWVGFIFTRNIYRQRLQLRLAQINLAEEQREKNQFQISAIANSLNPHFIKNTLMWMQSRFRKDAEVVDVIDRLAYNIGNVFAHSRQGAAFHTLEEEFKVTENFLAIQLATYGRFVNITLPDSSEWLAYRNIKVPLLIFQIHVENAIEHGLRKKASRDKNLALSIDDETDYLTICIEDDGIGRIAAKARGSQGTKQGTSMLDRIIELYNQKNQFQFNVTYVDLYDMNTGNATGTKVEIRIPKHFKTDLK